MCQNKRIEQLVVLLIPLANLKNRAPFSITDPRVWWVGFKGRPKGTHPFWGISHRPTGLVGWFSSQTEITHFRGGGGEGGVDATNPATRSPLPQSPRISGGPTASEAQGPRSLVHGLPRSLAHLLASRKRRGSRRVTSPLPKETHVSGAQKVICQTEIMHVHVSMCIYIYIYDAYAYTGTPAQ